MVTDERFAEKMGKMYINLFHKLNNRVKAKNNDTTKICGSQLVRMCGLKFLYGW